MLVKLGNTEQTSANGREGQLCSHYIPYSGVVNSVINGLINGVICASALPLRIPREGE